MVSRRQGQPRVPQQKEKGASCPPKIEFQVRDLLFDQPCERHMSLIYGASELYIPFEDWNLGAILAYGVHLMDLDYTT